jgi:hypothetical protein
MSRQHAAHRRYVVFVRMRIFHQAVGAFVRLFA